MADGRLWPIALSLGRRSLRHTELMSIAFASSGRRGILFLFTSSNRSVPSVQCTLQSVFRRGVCRDVVAVVIVDGKLSIVDLPPHIILNILHSESHLGGLVRARRRGFFILFLL